MPVLPVNVSSGSTDDGGADLSAEDWSVLPRSGGKVDKASPKLVASQCRNQLCFASLRLSPNAHFWEASLCYAQLSKIPQEHVGGSRQNLSGI